MADQPPDPSAAIADRLAACDGPLRAAPRDLLLRLASSGKLVRADIGRVLIPPGKPLPAVFVILEGRVRCLGLGLPDTQPELLETLGPGGIPGLASILSGFPIEAATAAEDCLCLMLEPEKFRSILQADSGFWNSLEQTITSPEIFQLVAGDLAARAKDVSKAAGIVRAARAGDGDMEDFIWWVAEGPRRGERWNPSLGEVRRIGIPASFLEEPEVASNAGQSPAQPPADLPLAETLLDPLVDYPAITTTEGTVSEITACFEMVAKQFGKSFPKDAVRRVLQNELPESRKATLNICGTVAAIAGFAAQLVKLPATNFSRVETPCLLLRDDTVCVLFETGQR
jgi:subfamily B ATP-binding cassette protein HlyB/CyaB